MMSGSTNLWLATVTALALSFGMAACGGATEEAEGPAQAAVASDAAEEPSESESAQEYEITRSTDGPFSFSVFGVAQNEGSTMQRESIVLNAPDCPIRFVSASMSFDFEDRRFRYNVATQIETDVPVAALEVRHALFDVFGDHIQNLANTEATDFAPGGHSLTGTWDIFQANEVSEHLTTVSYVYQVRLVDGRVWEVDSSAVIAALQSLDLDREIEDDPGS